MLLKFPTKRCDGKHCSQIISINKLGVPETLYWNVEYNEIYCSPQCGLKNKQLRGPHKDGRYLITTNDNVIREGFVWIENEIILKPDSNMRWLLGRNASKELINMKLVDNIYYDPIDNIV